MNDRKLRKLVLGFKVLDELPPVLQPLADAVAECYTRHHTDMRALYVVGSVAIGQWSEGASDLDVIGIVDRASQESEAMRRLALTELGNAWPQVTFVNNFALSLEALHAKEADVMTVGLARIIAVCGLHVWGERLDFQEFFPDVRTMAFERTARAKILIQQYRAGKINEPSRSNPRILARSSAKAGIRALSGITILRGAVFYSSPHETVEMVIKYAPEAADLARRAIAIVDGAAATPSEAMGIAEQAIELFYDLYPDALAATPT